MDKTKITIKYNDTDLPEVYHFKYTFKKRIGELDEKYVIEVPDRTIVTACV